MSAPIIIIPARMGATRLPGKPLALIAGRPMILHVLERALAAAIGPVVVACCEPELARVVLEAGGTAVMTDPALPSGTDRVQAALDRTDPTGRHDIVINLQGDLPNIDPAALRAVLTPLTAPEIDIGTLVAPVTNADDLESASIVKTAIAFSADQTVARALYFSRAVIPWGAGPQWQHIGVYAFRRLALQRFVALPPSVLELRERLEQLRALEAGMVIGAARVEVAPVSIDTPADLEKLKKGQGSAPCLNRGDPLRAEPLEP